MRFVLRLVNERISNDVICKGYNTIMYNRDGAKGGFIYTFSPSLKFTFPVALNLLSLRKEQRYITLYIIIIHIYSTYLSRYL
jgi:hypothetical protein